MIQPLQDRLLVELLPDPPRAITLTDAEKYRYFKVVATGPKVYEVKRGDIVALPGVGSTDPDHVIPEGQFVREGDVGFIIRF